MVYKYIHWDVFLRHPWLIYFLCAGFTDTIKSNLAFGINDLILNILHSFYKLYLWKYTLMTEKYIYRTSKFEFACIHVYNYKYHFISLFRAQTTYECLNNMRPDMQTVHIKIEGNEHSSLCPMK